MRSPLVVGDMEYPCSEDVIVDETGAVDPKLGVRAKVSSFIEVLRLGGGYELVYQLWVRFLLSTVRVNVDVTQSRGEVLVSASTCPYCLRSPCASSLLPVLVLHTKWDVSSNFVSLRQLGNVTREMQRGV